MASSNKPTLQQIKRKIAELERKYKIKPLLFEAVVSRESAFKIDASGFDGEYGLSQVTPAVVHMYMEREMNLPDSGGRGWHADTLNLNENWVLNLEIGAWYLGKIIPAYLKHYEHKDTVENRVWAYNAGIGNLNNGIKPSITRRYIDYVQDYLNQNERTVSPPQGFEINSALGWIGGFLALYLAYKTIV